MAGVLDIQTGVRGYLLSDDLKFLNKVYSTMDGLNSKINIIDSLVYENTEQKAYGLRIEKTPGKDEFHIHII